MAFHVGNDLNGPVIGGGRGRVRPTLLFYTRWSECDRASSLFGGFDGHRLGDLYPAWLGRQDWMPSARVEQAGISDEGL